MKDSGDALQRELQVTVPATAEIYQKPTDERLLNSVKNADWQPQRNVSAERWDQYPTGVR